MKSPGWQSLHPALLLLLTVTSSCHDSSDSDPALTRRKKPPEVPKGRYFPPLAEKQAAAPLPSAIARSDREFKRLVRGDPSRFVFKDEEGTGSDRVMSTALRGKLDRLADLVDQEWPTVRVRITEAWDEEMEHGSSSLHYAGRAADITTSDLDSNKLSRLAGLAVLAGFDWVYNEGSHIHVSVK